MEAGERVEDSCPKPFPEDFGERLNRLTELAGLSREEFAERLVVESARVTEWLVVESARVTEWLDGAVPTGGEVWHIMRLAWSVPGGIAVMLPETAGDAE